MFGMGQWEILIIFLVILLVFGARRIPEMAQGLGKGIKEFRKAMRDVQEEIDVKNTVTPSSHNTLQTSTPPQSVAQHAAGAPATQPAKEQTETSSSKTA